MDRLAARNVSQLGAAVRQLRTERKLTQQQLADQAGVSRRWLVMLEGGQSPRAELSKVFDVLRALDTRLTMSPAPPPTAHEQAVLDLLDDQGE